MDESVQAGIDRAKKRESARAVPDLGTLRRDQMASDAEYIEQLEQLSLGQEREVRRLQAIVDATMAAVGDDAPARPEYLPHYVGALLNELLLLHRAHDAAVAAVARLDGGGGT